MQKEHLAAALDFPQDGFADGVLAVFGDKGFDREAGFRGGVHHAHIAEAGQSHVQGAGNGRGAEGQHIHFLAQLFQGFLVADAETLFLVHHDQAEVLELHILLQQAVGADNDVHRALLQAGEDAFLLFGGAETA